MQDGLNYPARERVKEAQDFFQEVTNKMKREGGVMGEEEGGEGE